MEFEMWLIFFIAYLVTTLSPGPNVILVLKNSIQYGWRSAIITIFGNLSCQLVIVILVAVGVGELLQKLPEWFLVMKIIGGSYLIYLGTKTFIKNNKSIPDTNDLTKLKLSRNIDIFKESFFVSASNPKTLIFLSAFLPQFISSSYSVNGQFFIMYASICLIVASVHIGYAILFSSISKNISFKRFETKIDKITGGLFVSMGVGVLASSRS